MKIQLDTEAKEIRIEESVLLSELINTLEGLLPNGLWKEYKLVVTIIQNWSYPIVYPQPYNPYNPYNPYKYGDITRGTFNIEYKHTF